MNLALCKFKNGAVSPRPQRLAANQYVCDERQPAWRAFSSCVSEAVLFCYSAEGRALCLASYRNRPDKEEAVIVGAANGMRFTSLFCTIDLIGREVAKEKLCIIQTFLNIMFPWLAVRLVHKARDTFTNFSRNAHHGLLLNPELGPTLL